MNLQEISQKMKESKIIRVYIYLWIIVAILFGIGIFIYLNSNELFSLWLNILMSVCFVIIIIAGFIFRARFLLLAGFIKGDKTTIKFQMGAIIVVLITLLTLYKFFMERWGIALFFSLLIVGLLIMVFDFLRLGELKTK